jgi:hypothetical protein
VFKLKLGKILVIQVTDKIQDTAFGYFSQLEFASDLEISLPCTREICHIVRRAMEQRNKVQEQGVDSTHSQGDPEIPAADNLGRIPDTMDSDSTAALASYVSTARGPYRGENLI